MKIASPQALRGANASALTEQLVTFVVDGQAFGISALTVRDVLRRQPLTRIPLARAEIAGAINLRGHIVSAIDLRARLGMAPRPANCPAMCVVVEHAGESVCLIVDSVGDVISVDCAEIEPNPASLQPMWAQAAKGVHRARDHLLLLLDVGQLLTF
ncbi:MAG: chemotaxis protein CheW [Rhodospirillaceae bacterium]|nr:chemotaxis protein CheW [Rhodospirillaceae bacterium]